MNIELRHLRYFLVVAEELHFSRAAERLHIAQPPLSQMIRRLEHELGVTLFHRTKREVALTDAGVIFLEEAKRTLAQAEHAIRSVRRAHRGELGRLVVGFIGSAAYSVLPPIVRCFREQYPDVDLTLQELIRCSRFTDYVTGVSRLAFFARSNRNRRSGAKSCCGNP